MRLIAPLLFVMVTACAQEPTTPSSVSLLGTWVSPSVNIFSLSEVTMYLSKQDTGIVRGEWTAKGTGGNGGCPVATPCNASGHVIGRTTISRVEIEILGAGKFEGRLVDENTLRGSMALSTAYDTMTFHRTSKQVPVTTMAR